MRSICGAILLGCESAFSVLIGAAIRKHNIDEECRTMLVGGLITSSIGLIVTICTSAPKGRATDEETVSCIVGLTQFVAFLTAPLMGERILGYGVNWQVVIVDNLIGSSVLAGVVLLVAMLYFLIGAIYTFFKGAIRVPSSDPMEIQIQLESRV